MIAGLLERWHLGTPHTVVVPRCSAPFPFQPCLHGPSRLGKSQLVRGCSYIVQSVQYWVSMLAGVWLRYPSSVESGVPTTVAIFARLA